MKKPFNIHDWQHKFATSMLDLTLEQEDFEKKDTKTVSALANKFLDISKKMRAGEYPGLQSAEINEIDDLIDMVLQAAVETNITTVIKRLEGMVGKSIKTKKSNLDDEEIDEANVTGTGTSISTGFSPAYATPFAFGKKKKKDIEVLGYKKVNEAHGLDKEDVETLETLINQMEQGTINSKKVEDFIKVLQFIVDSNIKVDQTKDLSKEKNELKVPYRKSGYMGYSEPVKKPK
jgi:hypothetical protein